MELKVKELLNNYITFSILFVATALSLIFYEILFKKNQFLFWVILIVIIASTIWAIIISSKNKSSIPNRSSIETSDFHANPSRENRGTKESGSIPEIAKKLMKHLEESKRDEKIFIQKQIEEVRQFTKDFSFTTRYIESENYMVEPKSAIRIENKSGNAIRMFFVCTKNILSNCLNKRDAHPLDNDSFTKVFPSGNMISVNDIKSIVSKFSKIIDFIMSSNSYKDKDKIVLQNLDNLIEDIRYNLLNYEGILLEITDDLFPKMIQLCEQRRIIPINNLQSFFDGLIEIKNKFNELKKCINSDVIKDNGNPV